MSRPAPTIPVSPKMYRHFAVITVGITGCLALFADGENRQAIESQIAARQQANAMNSAEAELTAKGKGGAKSKEIFRDNRKVQGSFGADPGIPGMTEVGYDPGMNAEMGLGDSVRYQTLPSTAADDADAQALGKPPPGMTMEEWLALKQQGRKGRPKQKRMTAADSARLGEAAIADVNTPKF